MTNAPVDGNGRFGMIGLSSADGLTVTPITANPANNALSVSNGTTGTDHGYGAHVDGDGQNVVFALSSAGDGTKVPLYVDGSNKVLIKST